MVCFIYRWNTPRLAGMIECLYDNFSSWQTVGSRQQMSHSRKHPYHPHGGNRKLTSLPPSDVLIHLLLSDTIFSPLPLRTAEISSVGGVWIFSGMTQ